MRKMDIWSYWKRLLPVSHIEPESLQSFGASVIFSVSFIVRNADTSTYLQSREKIEVI